MQRALVLGALLVLTLLVILVIGAAGGSERRARRTAGFGLLGLGLAAAGVVVVCAQPGLGRRAVGGAGRRRGLRARAVPAGALAREYGVWLLARELMSIGCGPGSIVRCRVVLEGWIAKAYDPALSAASPHGVLAGALRAPEALAEDLRKAGLAPEKAAQVEAAVRVLAAREARPEPPAAVEQTPTGYRYGKFAVEATDRLRTMVRLAGAEATVRVCLRYASMLAGSHHWAVPEAVFDLLWGEGVRNEAFASPLNAGMLGRKGGRYFSLFADTDAPFGSLGDLFEHPRAELLALKGGWEVNPPFLGAVLDRAAALAAELAAGRDVVFVTRQHDPGRGTQSPYLAFEAVAKASRVLPPGEHAYAVHGPAGVVLRTASFPTRLLYGGPRSAAASEALLDRLVGAWPRAGAPYSPRAAGPAEQG